MYRISASAAVVAVIIAILFCEKGSTAGRLVKNDELSGVIGGLICYEPGVPDPCIPPTLGPCPDFCVKSGDDWVCPTQQAHYAIVASQFLFCNQLANVAPGKALCVDKGVACVAVHDCDNNSCLENAPYDGTSYSCVLGAQSSSIDGINLQPDGMNCPIEFTSIGNGRIDVLAAVNGLGFSAFAR